MELIDGIKGQTNCIIAILLMMVQLARAYDIVFVSKHLHQFVELAAFSRLVSP